MNFVLEGSVRSMISGLLRVTIQKLRSTTFSSVLIPVIDVNYSVFLKGSSINDTTVIGGQWFNNFVTAELRP